MKKVDIKIIKLSKRIHKGIQPSYLSIDISGKSVNPAVVNTLRRVILDEVPVYSFCEQTINITKNKSAFNNDQMKERLSQLPIFNLENDIEYLSERYWLNVDYSDQSRERHPKDNDKIEITCSVKNDDLDILNVTTNDIKIFKNDEEITNNYSKEYPILLIQLRPEDYFEFDMKAVMGIGKRNNIWTSASTCYFDDYLEDASKDDPDKYKFTIESQGQHDEIDILIKACDVINKKLDIIEDMVKNRYFTPKIKNSKKLILELVNENHTMGNIINDALQEHPNVKLSGSSKPDHLIDAFLINIQTFKNDPTIAFFESIKYLKELYGSVKKQVKGLKK